VSVFGRSKNDDVLLVVFLNIDGKGDTTVRIIENIIIVRIFSQRKGLFF